MGFVLQDELRVAREAMGETVRRAGGLREGQHGDRVGAADGGRESRERAAQDIVPRVAARHHPPGGFGEDQGGGRRESAGLLDARPQAARRAEFGDAHELVGVGGEAQGDQAAGGLDIEAVVDERAQIGDAGRQREGELLRLRAARRMDHPRVRDRDAGAVARAGDAPGFIGETLRLLRPGRGREAMQGLQPERIEAEGNARDGGFDVLAVDVAQDGARRVGRARRRLDDDRYAVVEADVGEETGDRLVTVVGQARATGALRAGEDDVQAVGAAFEVLERQPVGGVGVGEVDAAEDRPAAGGAAQRARPGGCRARIERGDGRAVIGLRDEPVEGAALQRLVDKLAPLLFGRLWKNPGDGCLVGAHLDLTPRVCAPFAMKRRLKEAGPPPQFRAAGGAGLYFPAQNP